MVATTHKTDWLHAAKWGVFFHYIVDESMTVEEWNARVDAFDVDGLARQLASVGVPYCCFSIGQNSGHFCAPNAVYDRYVGITPSKCSRRDLIADLYTAFVPYGIDLMVYLPSGAPDRDFIAMERLQWTCGWNSGYEGFGSGTNGQRLAAFQRMWEEIISAWSLQWGDRVRGWWFDGCYFADDMYRFPDAPNFASFAAAARTGNPASLLAFNPGVTNPIVTMTSEEDYTAGEINDPHAVMCKGRWVEHAQFHLLSYLGHYWAASPLRFTDEEVIAVTNAIISHGGVVTWDVPIGVDGLVSKHFLAQLAALHVGVRHG